MKRNDHAGFRLLTVTVGRCRKPPSDLRKRALVTVGRRWRSPVSAGLPADYLRTAGPSDTLCIRSERVAIAATFSVEELRACVGRSVPSLGPLHMLSRNRGGRREPESGRWRRAPADSARFDQASRGCASRAVVRRPLLFTGSVQVAGEAYPARLISMRESSACGGLSFHSSARRPNNGALPQLSR